MKESRAKYQVLQLLSRLSKPVTATHIVDLLQSNAISKSSIMYSLAKLRASKLVDIHEGHQKHTLHPLAHYCINPQGVEALEQHTQQNEILIDTIKRIKVMHKNYTMEQYLEDAQRTKSDVDDILVTSPAVVDMLHAAFGLVTESGEMLDAFKKSLFYRKPLDYVNLDEEAGDMLWYLAIYVKARGTTFEALAERNAKKLKTRYPEKFTSEHAITRDLDKERTTLEGKSHE